MGLDSAVEVFAKLLEEFIEAYCVPSNKVKPASHAEKKEEKKEYE